MRFLADECCDRAIIRVLKEAGYDVLSVSETAQQASDTDVLKLATVEGRILITEDKDFGQLFFAYTKGLQGVIFLRYPFKLRDKIAQDVIGLIRSRGKKLTSSFVVVQPGRIRVGHMPQG